MAFTSVTLVDHLGQITRQPSDTALRQALQVLFQLGPKQKHRACQLECLDERGGLSLHTAYSLGNGSFQEVQVHSDLVKMLTYENAEHAFEVWREFLMAHRTERNGS